MTVNPLARILSAALLAATLGACSPNSDSQKPNDQASQADASVPGDSTAPDVSPAPSATPEQTATPTSAPPPATPKPATPRPATPRPQAAAPTPQPTVCSDCGTIASITAVQQKGDGSGAGAIAGAVAGGVAGHQVGGGRGKDVATAAGAILGAMAGHEVEKRVRSNTVYDIAVSMDTGSQRVIRVMEPAGLAVGTPVRVEGNNIYLR